MARTDRFGVEVRERVMWDIREGVVGSDTFIPKHVVILTWKNMSFAGGIDNSLFKVSLRHMPSLAVDLTIKINKLFCRLIPSKWSSRLMKFTRMPYSIMQK
jgi:hypothetical protein